MGIVEVLFLTKAHDLVQAIGVVLVLVERRVVGGVVIDVVAVGAVVEDASFVRVDRVLLVFVVVLRGHLLIDQTVDEVLRVILLVFCSLVMLLLRCCRC